MPHAPAISLVSGLQPDGHGRVLTDDCLAFARNPDQRAGRRDVGIPPVLPVPSEAIAVRHVPSEDAAVQRLDLPPILGPVPFDFRHHTARRNTYSMLLINAFCVSGFDPSQRPMGPGIRRTVEVTCNSSRWIAESGFGDLAAQAGDGDLLEEVVVFRNAHARVANE